MDRQLIQTGRAEDLYLRPANLFAAGFLAGLARGFSPALAGRLGCSRIHVMAGAAQGPAAATYGAAVVATVALGLAVPRWVPIDVAAALAGCMQLAPRYERPAAPVPATFPNAAWRVKKAGFKDP